MLGRLALTREIHQTVAGGNRSDACTVASALAGRGVG